MWVRTSVATLLSRNSLLRSITVVIPLATILVVLHFIMGRPFYPRTYGTVVIDSPQIYTRERLVNDRFREDAWLADQLKASENASIALSAILEQKTELLVDAESQPSTPNDSKGAEPAPPALTAADHANPDHKLTGKFDNFLDYYLRFQKLSELRSKIRQAIIENQLDDRHDIGSNSLYLFKFGVSIIPGQWTDAPVLIDLVLKQKDALPPISGIIREDGLCHNLYEFECAYAYERKRALNSSRSNEAAEQIKRERPNIETTLEDLKKWRALYDRWRSNIRQRLSRAAATHKRYYESGEPSTKNGALLKQFSERLLSTVQSGLAGYNTADISDDACKPKEYEAGKTASLYLQEAIKSCINAHHDRIQDGMNSLNPPYPGNAEQKRDASKSVLAQRLAAYFDCDQGSVSPSIVVKLVPNTNELALTFDNLLFRSLGRCALNSFLKELTLALVMGSQQDIGAGDFAPPSETSTYSLGGYGSYARVLFAIGQQAELVTQVAENIQSMYATPFEALDCWNRAKLKRPPLWQMFDLNNKIRLPLRGLDNSTWSARIEAYCNGISREAKSEENSDSVKKIVNGASGIKEADAESAIGSSLTRDFVVFDMPIPGLRDPRTSSLSPAFINALLAGTDVDGGIPTDSATNDDLNIGSLISAPVGLFSFITRLSSVQATYSYSVNPRGNFDLIGKDIERALKLASQVNSGAVSGKAAIKSDTSITEIQQVATILGFGTEAQMNSSGLGSDEELTPSKDDKSTEYKQGHARFGWAILPQNRQGELWPLGNGTMKAQSHTLTALVSVPAWWKQVNITGTISWLGRDMKPEVSVLPNVDYVIDLPAKTELIDNLLFDVSSRPPTISEDVMDNLEVVACQKANLLIPGSRLWRSTAVILGAQNARLIQVLPDMDGIIVSFDTIEPPPNLLEDFTNADTSKRITDLMVPLSVWTSEGHYTATRQVKVVVPMGVRDQIRRNGGKCTPLAPSQPAEQ